MDVILAANDISNPSLIFAGQEIVIPGADEPLPTPTPRPTPTPTSPPTSTGTYTVQPGDTLSSIAERFDTTVEAIMQANGIQDPDVISVGQVLIIPGENDLLRIVDKERALPASYVPPNLVGLPQQLLAPGEAAARLRQRAGDALAAMLADARAQGFDIRVTSAYRSYQTQQDVFQYWVDLLGEASARRVSAVPGHSEHQLGTTVDVSSAAVDWQLVQGFGNTAPGRWLDAHAHEYGFALSYPPGAEAITGYKYEPWHFRFIGQTHAARWASSGLTLIEYLERVHGLG